MKTKKIGGRNVSSYPETKNKYDMSWIEKLWFKWMLRWETRGGPIGMLTRIEKNREKAIKNGDVPNYGDLTQENE